MSKEERNTVFAIVTNMIVNLWMAIRLHGLWLSGAFDGPDGLMIWARTVIWVIPASIGVTILVAILGSILVAIVTRDPLEPNIFDERDRLFRIRGMSVTMIVAAAGFVVVLCGLAWGWSALLAMTVIYASYSLGDLLGNVVKLLSYRHGV
jgi:hypothetical protein